LLNQRYVDRVLKALSREGNCRNGECSKSNGLQKQEPKQESKPNNGELQKSPTTSQGTSLEDSEIFRTNQLLNGGTTGFE
jgi:hypothetical protein